MNQAGLTVNIQKRLDAGTLQFVKAGHSHAMILRNFDAETGEELPPTQIAIGLEQIDEQIAEHEKTLADLQAIREKLVETKVDILAAITEATQRIGGDKASGSVPE